MSHKGGDEVSAREKAPLHSPSKNIVILGAWKKAKVSPTWHVSCVNRHRRGFSHRVRVSSYKPNRINEEGVRK